MPDGWRNERRAQLLEMSQYEDASWNARESARLPRMKVEQHTHTPFERPRPLSHDDNDNDVRTAIARGSHIVVVVVTAAQRHRPRPSGKLVAGIDPCTRGQHPWTSRPAGLTGTGWGSGTHGFTCADP